MALDVSWEKAAFKLGRSDTAALDETASLSQISHHVQILPVFSYSLPLLRVVFLRTLLESCYHAVVMFP